MMEFFWGIVNGEAPAGLPVEGGESLILPGLELHWQAAPGRVRVERRPGWVLFQWGSLRPRSTDANQPTLIDALCAGVPPQRALRAVEGEFFLLIWQEAERKLTLAADPIGMTRLYYGRRADSLVVSSHAALAARGCGSLEISPEGVGLLLSLKGVAAPYSILRGISALLPAEVLEISPQGEHSTIYWDLFDLPEEPYTASFEQAQLDLMAQLKASFDRLLAAGGDPPGLCLSGGVDSAFLLGMARKSGIPMRAYTVGYTPGSDNDETEAARQNAELLGVKAVVLKPTDAEIAAVLAECVPAMHEPNVDASALPQLYLARAARSEVGSLMDGTGSDNIFCSLVKYKAESLVEKYRRIPGFLRRGLAAPALALLPSSRRSALTNWARKAQKFTLGAELPLDSRLAYWSRLMPQELAQSMLHPDWRLEADPADELLTRLRRRGAQVYSDLAAETIVGLRGTLPIRALQKLMLMQYAAGILVHAPYTVPGMVEFALRLPDDYKLRGDQSKRVLRAAAAQILPPECLQRKKANFSPPIGRWLTGVFRDELMDLLKDAAPFNRPQIEKMLAQQESEWRDWQWELWAAFVTLKWQREVKRWPM